MVAFEAIWPDQSGVVVPHDAKSLAVTDINDDGWCDFVVGVNNRPVEAFIHNGVVGRRMVNVKLKGPAGNPTAVGALVTVELAGGTSQSAEVSAGGGYLSQSSAALVFGLPSGDEFQVVRVRWPDGSETSHVGRDDQVVVDILEHPGP